MTPPLVPDLVARVRFLPTNEGGRVGALPDKQFGCPFVFEDEMFDCRLLLDQVGHAVDPGEIVAVPIKFLNPTLIKARLRPGSEFRLWDARFFAEGTVLQVLE